MERGFPYVMDRVKLTNRLRTIFGSISNRWLKSTIQNSATETCQLPTIPGTPETSNRRVTSTRASHRCFRTIGREQERNHGGVMRTWYWVVASCLLLTLGANAQQPADAPSSPEQTPAPAVFLDPASSSDQPEPQPRDAPAATSPSPGR